LAQLLLNLAAMTDGVHIYFDNRLREEIVLR